MTALPTESARLAALERYAILDTTPEEAFDELAHLAAMICEVPIALISLVDRSRQWFKSRVGIDASETPRNNSFCDYAIREDELFVVYDAQVDPRFAANPLVTGVPHIRFYAGAQLTTPDGLNVGTLCVIDTKPRVLTAEQRNALRSLARQVMVQLELRRQVAERSADIARRVRIERELDQFFSLSIDLLCIADLAGHFKRLNPAFANVFGYSLDEMLHRPFLDFIHPDDREKTVLEMAGLRCGRDTTNFENRYICRDGSTKWISWTASPVPEEGLIYAAGRDVTSARMAEEALRRSDARTRSIIDHALGGLITMNCRGIIESANPAAARMFGLGAHELIGRDIVSLFAEAFQLDSAVGRVTERRAHRSDASEFACELSLFEFSAGDDERHFAAHMLDISERHEVDRMKNDFIATVSHELRTPLTSIRGSLGLLAAGVMGELSAEARQMVAVAERNSVRLIALINDILDFEKLESGKMEMDLRPTSLLRVLERSIETISAAAVQEGVRIELHAGSASVRGDEQRLTQVVVNLLSNAVKYSHAGGVVTLRAEAHASFVEVQVEDRGSGIPEQAQARIFERFHQIDSSDARRKPGTGLGLAICKAIVEQHGGSIGVISREGEGSTFWFRVPLASSDAPALQWREEQGDVVIVEDDAALLDVMRAQLAAAHIPARTARSGWEGLAAIHERAPAVIVLDVDLPDLDGYTVVSELRNHVAHRNVPLLVYSGVDLSASQRKRLQLGPTRFLMKSRSTDDEFRAAVGQLLDYSRAREIA